MQVSQDELMAEAGQLALECRLKDRIIAGLQAENASLRAQLEQPAEAVDPGQAESPGA